MAGEIEARLKALDLVLPEVPLPVADYVSFLHLNGQLFVAGQLPLKDGMLAVTGTLGAGVESPRDRTLRVSAPSIFSPRQRPRSGTSTASSSACG